MLIETLIYVVILVAGICIIRALPIMEWLKQILCIVISVMIFILLLQILLGHGPLIHLNI